MQYYAVGSEDVTKRFDLILRSGNEYSIPYSLLPIYKLSGGKKLDIIAYDLVITISGRNLAPVKKYLAKESLIWMKESPSGKDDGQSETFISNIEIKGEAVNK
ncbi:hypothetical protein Q4Q35_10825 [Flavivirga aquimarina]|uniref:Phage tail protein n=1 Tax=Flavivirga aquimarina TaxID=2027862 RepID=A0ABT8WB76_9FLAO|nr:hypothetical protein [Flavivirga aquimarina]MDO5970299.1 hypothetical protein [Flavivirga aquimarina]